MFLIFGHKFDQSILFELHPFFIRRLSFFPARDCVLKMRKSDPIIHLKISGSRTEPEPEFYKPALSYFCRTLTEPEPYFSKSQRANRN